MRKTGLSKMANTKDAVRSDLDGRYEAAAPKVKRAVAQLTSEGTAISEAARAHPAAAAGIVLTSMAAGLLIGFLLGAQSIRASSNSWHW